MELAEIERQTLEFFKTKIWSNLVRATPDDVLFVKIDIYRFNPELVQKWQNMLAAAYPNLRLVFMDLNDEVERVSKEQLVSYLKINQAEDLLTH